MVPVRRWVPTHSSRTTKYRSRVDDVVNAAMFRIEAAHCTRVRSIHNRITRQCADISSPQHASVGIGVHARRQPPLGDGRQAVDAHSRRGCITQISFYHSDDMGWQCGHTGSSAWGSCTAKHAEQGVTSHPARRNNTTMLDTGVPGGGRFVRSARTSARCSDSFAGTSTRAWPSRWR